MAEKMKRSQNFFEYSTSSGQLVMKLKEVKALAISDHILKIFSKSPKVADVQGEYCSECKARFIMMFRKRHSCTLCFEDFCNE